MHLSVCVRVHVRVREGTYMLARERATKGAVPGAFYGPHL